MLRPDDAVAIATLRSPATMRARAEQLLNLGTAGSLEHFSIDLGKIDGVARDLAALVPRLIELDAETPASRLAPSIAALSSDDQSKASVDGVFVDAILAGLRGEVPAGLDPIALFAGGAFGAGGPRVDAATLSAFEATAYEGRGARLRSLGDAIAAAPQWFPEARPSGLIEALVGKPDTAAPADHDATWPHRLVPSIEATAILRLLLEGLDGVWAGSVAIGGVKVGDVWKHGKLAGNGAAKGLMPLHALALRTAGALFDPLERAGYTIVQPNALPAVVDERTTGLLLDGGVLVPKYREVTELVHEIGDEVVVEARGLAVALYERVATATRQVCSKAASELPMNKIVEAATTLGRTYATRRPQAIPPLRMR